MPASDVHGEQAAPTQPIPVKPPTFSAQFLDETNITNIGAANRAAVLARLREIRGGPAFNPPSRQGTVVIPGFHGGANWSGACFDPTTGLLYLNSNNVPNILTLVESKPGDRARYGPFIIKGYVQFLDHEGYPAIKPPWGVLSAINLSSGQLAWQVPLGEHVELTARGIPRTGTETFGGSIVTAGGLIFIAGTKDERFHAFDKQTGKLLWEHPLPAGGYATPSTYQVGEVQYVVIAAGGAGKLQTKAGDAFVAFRLLVRPVSPVACVAHRELLQHGKGRAHGPNRSAVGSARRPVCGHCVHGGGAANRRSLARQAAGRRRYQGRGDQPDTSVASGGSDEVDHQRQQADDLDLPPHPGQEHGHRDADLSGGRLLGPLLGARGRRSRRLAERRRA